MLIEVSSAPALPKVAEFEGIGCPDCDADVAAGAAAGPVETVGSTTVAIAPLPLLLD